MRFAALFRPAALTATISLALAFAAPASAQIVLGQQVGVDINSQPSTVGYGTVANWTAIDAFTNVLASLALAPALDLSTGSSISGVTIGLAYSGIGASGGINNLGATATSNSIASAPHLVTYDGAYGVATSGASTLTLTFYGLDNTLSYNLEIFSVSTVNDDLDIPSINGVATTWDIGFRTRYERFYQPTGALFTGLVTNGSGALSFSISDSIYHNAIMNGAVLTATSPIPEPSTYAAFAGLGALGLALYRRRVRA